MALKKLAPIAILAISVCAPIFFLLWNEAGWVSLIFLCAIFVSATIYIVKKDHVFLFVSILIASHFLFSPGIQVSRFFIFCMLLVCVAFLFFYKPLQISRNLQFFLVLLPLYFLVILIIRPYQVHLGWLLLFVEILLMVLLTLYFSWDKNSIEKTITLHFCFLLLFGIIEIIWFFQPRIEGPIVSASAFGVMLSTEWAIWIGFQIGRPSLKWQILIPMFVATLVVVFATGSRMSLLAIVMSLFLATAIRLSLNNKYSFAQMLRFVLIVSLIIGSVITFWVILPNDLLIKDRMQSLIQGDLDYSNKFRVFAWLAGFDAIKSHPFWGVGNGNFLKHVSLFFANSGLPQWLEGGTKMLIHPHNLYIRAFAENGLMGGIYLFLLLGSLFKNILATGPFNKNNIKIGLLLGSVTLLTLGFFDSVPFYEPTMIWGVFLVALTFKIPKAESASTK